MMVTSCRSMAAARYRAWGAACLRGEPEDGHLVGSRDLEPHRTVGRARSRNSPSQQPRPSHRLLGDCRVRCFGFQIPIASPASNTPAWPLSTRSSIIRFNSRKLGGAFANRSGGRYAKAARLSLPFGLRPSHLPEPSKASQHSLTRPWGFAWTDEVVASRGPERGQSLPESRAGWFVAERDLSFGRPDH